MADPRSSSAGAVTRAATHSTTCPQCGTTVSSSLSTCVKCGAVIAPGTSGDDSERLRARLQQSIGDTYQLVEVLGRGGMGIVFRAREVALDREVALKVLAIDPIFSPEAYARFEREAKLAARLEHPGIVPIFSVGHRESVAYYTMRLVRGGSVETMLESNKQIAFERVIAILRDVAAALDYAHRQGVVHRDVKPANILIGDTGHANVADFGIAKALGPSNNSTGTGIIGSPAYMSPEQWRGENVDGRADQYALAIVAFEMLSGHRPFKTVRIEDLLTLHLSAEVPDVTQLRPGLDASVDGSIRRALSKSPSDRFSSATAFVDALAGKRPVAPMANTLRGPRFEKRPRRKGAWIVVLLVAAGLAGALANPLTRAPALQFWKGVLHASVLVRDQATVAVERATAPETAVLAANPDDSASSAISDLPPNGGDGSDTIARGESGDAPDISAREMGASGPSLERRPLGIDNMNDVSGAAGSPFRSASTSEFAYIRVIVNGGSAPVLVDGRAFGFAPQIVRVEPGSHVVSVRGAGDMFMPFQHSVTVESRDTVTATFAVPGTPRQRPDTIVSPDSAPVPAQP